MQGVGAAQGPVARLVRSLFETGGASQLPASRRQSRLLATFLCLLFVVFGIADSIWLVTVPGYRPPWYGYLWLTAAWLLNRAGRYTLAAALTLAMFPTVILAMIASGASAEPLLSLAYLALGVQLAGILLPARGTLLFAAATTAALVAAWRLAPERLPTHLVMNPLAMVAIAAGLAVVAIRHRDSLERDRQSEREALIGELESKNVELERFSYTVSHDLKSPLITIRGFLGLLAKDLEDGRHDRVAGDLERIKGAADSMERLLDELLKLSRIGRVANPPERVPLAFVVRDAVLMLRSQLDERGIRLEVDEPLPEVYGDRVRLVEVVQNLVENAAKFHCAGSDRWVRVGVRPGSGGEGPVCFVADNGVGIEPRHHERVFGLFEKLDAKAEGTGIGLALVRRVVEVHGGRVWIESEGNGRGTTVCFTLPAPKAE
jgi:signal transduction histidine kinase